MMNLLKFTRQLHVKLNGRADQHEQTLFFTPLLSIVKKQRSPFLK